MNSAFIDSNVIIKYFQGDENAKKLLEPVISGAIVGYINNIVFSEVVYYFIKNKTGLRAYDFKKNPEIVKSVIEELEDLIVFIKQFTELEINDEVKDQAVSLIKKYGILPNDALIMATCLHYGVSIIFSSDEDLKEVSGLTVKRL